MTSHLWDLSAPAHHNPDPAENAADSGLGFLRRQLLELRHQFALAFGQVCGVSTATWTYMSPVVSSGAPACLGGQPKPPARSGAAGDFDRALLPSIAGTSNSPPSAAVAMEIGTRQCKSAPSRWKNSCWASDRKI